MPTPTPTPTPPMPQPPNANTIDTTTPGTLWRRPVRSLRATVVDLLTCETVCVCVRVCMCINVCTRSGGSINQLAMFFFCFFLFICLRTSAVCNTFYACARARMQAHSLCHAKAQARALLAHKRRPARSTSSSNGGHAAAWLDGCWFDGTHDPEQTERGDSLTPNSVARIVPHVCKQATAYQLKHTSNTSGDQGASGAGDRDRRKRCRSSATVSAPSA